MSWRGQTWTHNLNDIATKVLNLNMRDLGFVSERDNHYLFNLHSINLVFWSLVSLRHMEKVGTPSPVG